MCDWGMSGVGLVIDEEKAVGVRFSVFEEINRLLLWLSPSVVSKWRMEDKQ